MFMDLTIALWGWHWNFKQKCCCRSSVRHGMLWEEDYSWMQKNPDEIGVNMGRITGFEPATPWATTRCSAN